MTVVYLAVDDLWPSPLSRSPTFVEIAEVCVVTEAADEMETVFPDAIAEGPVGEECVIHYEKGESQQLLAVPFDHPDVVLSE